MRLSSPPRDARPFTKFALNIYHLSPHRSAPGFVLLHRRAYVSPVPQTIRLSPPLISLLFCFFAQSGYMPSKHTAQDRAWGTRYDTLKLSTPPSSPSVQRKDTPTASSTPNSPSTTHTKDTTRSNSIATPTKPESTSQDASIFIGSLPTATDYLEVSRLLTEHLSEHPEIKSVKVVRDSKGGTCAFAQCDNASTASHLLEKLLNTAHQRPFLGRYLRFEYARAFRTLLISYRVPERTAFPNSGMDSSFDGDHPSDLTLPRAMRIYKPQNGKYYAVLYDAEAVDFESKVSCQASSGDVSSTRASLDGAGLFLSPLQFDGESLRKIAMAFGPVEHFGPFVSEVEGLASGPNLRSHSGPRSTAMDERIWEIKWEHRDDCMNAQMTLRNVPHLSVTWAHRSYADTGAGLESRFGSPSLASSPRFLPGSRSRTQSRSYHAPGTDLQRFVPAGMSPTMSALRIPYSPSQNASALSPRSIPFIPSSAPFTVRASPSVAADKSTTESEGQDTTVVADFSDNDFPPLRQSEGIRHPRKVVRPPALSWTLRDMQRELTSQDSALSASPSSSLSVQPSTPVPADGLMSPDSNESISSSGPYREDAELEDDSAFYGAQEIAVPPTPAFTTASITPITPGTALSFPHTPVSTRTAITAEESCATDSFGMSSKNDDIFTRHDMGKEINPLWIFAGSLDVTGRDPWTETKVRNVFCVYGDIEALEFYCKPGATCAFAFVKYQDTAASERAVAAEHLKLYNGRPIRVRLREMHPSSRAIQKFPKTRSRQPYGAGPGAYRRPYGNAAQLSDDLRVQPNLQLQQSFHPLSSDFAQPMATSVPRPAPSMAPATHSASSGANSPAKKAAATHDLVQERPVSATSGSIPSPPPSTAPPATIAHVQSYMAPPQPWMHAMAPYGYPIPYHPGYVGYAPAAGYRPGPAGAESVVHTPYQWPGYTYRPNPAVHQVVCQPAAPPAGETSHAQAQPPLRPAGFIEGDQLIPLYPPEALNQYMTGSNQTTSQSPPPHSASTTQPHSAPATASWPHYVPGPPPMVPYPYSYAQAMPPGAPSQQPPMAAGQYAVHPWPPTGAVPYLAAPHVFPSSHQHLHAGAYPQPFMPSQSSQSVAMAPSTSFRGAGNGLPLAAPVSQHDLGNASKGFPAAGPRRFVSHNGPPGHSADPGHGQGFRGMPRNGGVSPGRRPSPPHLSRRGSGGVSASYSFGGDGSGPVQGHPSPHQYPGSHPQHMHVRTSGSYPTIMNPAAMT